MHSLVMWHQTSDIWASVGTKPTPVYQVRMIKVENIHGFWVMFTIVLLEIFKIGVIDVALQAPINCTVVIGVQDVPKAELNIWVHSLVVSANTPGRFVVKVTVFAIVKPSRVTKVCVFIVVLSSIDRGLSIQ